jgi:uncharacterized protein YjeT (DUF2065 family)
MGMENVIKIIGIFIVLIGILFLLNPDIMKKLMGFMKKGKRIYLAGLLRFTLSVIFLLGAGECNYKWIIAAFGIIFLLSGLLIFALGPENIRRILDWYQNQPAPIFRVIAGIVLACGSVIVYSA